MSVLTPHLFPVGFVRMIRKETMCSLNNFPSLVVIHNLISIISKIINNFNIFQQIWWSRSALEPNLSTGKRERNSYWHLNLPKSVPDHGHGSSTFLLQRWTTKKKSGTVNFPSICFLKWYVPSGCFYMVRWNCKHPCIIISKSILFWITLCYEGNCMLVNSNILLTWACFSY